MLLPPDTTAHWKQFRRQSEPKDRIAMVNFTTSPVRTLLVDCHSESLRDRFSVLVLNRNEVLACAGSLDTGSTSASVVVLKLLERAAGSQLLVDDWVDLGLGRCSDRPDNEVGIASLFRCRLSRTLN